MSGRHLSLGVVSQLEPHDSVLAVSALQTGCQTSGVWVSKGVRDLVSMFRIGEEFKKPLTSFPNNEGAYCEIFRNRNWHLVNP